MSELKLTLPRFDGKQSSDFTLWKIRLESILLSKCLKQTIAPSTTETSSASTSLTTSSVNVLTEDDRRKAAAIIINGLGDKPLRLVAAHIHDPKVMLEKLCERYAPSKLSTRMSLMAELQGYRYKAEDMSDYVDKYTLLLDRLEAINAKVPSELAIIMFLHSMNGKYEAVIAALRTLGEGKLTWDEVTTRLIEEYNTSSSRRGTSISSSIATAMETTNSPKIICTHCGKLGHIIENCWWNPANPNNKVGKGKAIKGGRVKPRVNNTVSPHTQQAKGRSTAQDQSGPSSRRPISNKDKILMLNLTNHENIQKNGFLLDSGASCHMSCTQNWLHNVQTIEAREISLADNSTVLATSAGNLILEAPYHGSSSIKLTIKNVLFVPELELNLLSCSRLAEKGVACVFDKKDAHSLIKMTMMIF